MYNTNKIEEKLTVDAYFRNIRHLKTALAENNINAGNSRKGKKDSRIIEFELPNRKMTLNYLGVFFLDHKDAILASNQDKSELNQNKTLAKYQRNIFFSYLEGAYSNIRKNENTKIIYEGIEKFLNTLSEEIQKELNIVKNVLDKLHQSVTTQSTIINSLSNLLSREEFFILEENRIIIRIILKFLQNTSSVLKNYRNLYTSYNGKHRKYIFNYIDCAKIFNKDSKEYLLYLIDKNTSFRSFNKILLIEKNKNPLNLSTLKEFNEIIENLKKHKTEIFIKEFLLKGYRKGIIGEGKVLKYYNQSAEDRSFLYKIIIYKGIIHSKPKIKKVNEDTITLLTTFLTKTNFDELNGFVFKQWFFTLFSMALKSSAREKLLTVLFKEFDEKLYRKYMTILTPEERSFYLAQCVNINQYSKILTILVKNKFEIEPVNTSNNPILPLSDYKKILNVIKNLSSNNSEYLNNKQSIQFKKILPLSQYNSFFSYFPEGLSFFEEDFLSVKEIVDLIHHIYHSPPTSKEKISTLMGIHKSYHRNFENEQNGFLSTFILNITISLVLNLDIKDQISIMESFYDIVMTDKFLDNRLLKFINYSIFLNCTSNLCLDKQLDIDYSESELVRYQLFQDYLDGKNRNIAIKIFQKDEKYIFSKFKEEYKTLLSYSISFVHINKIGYLLAENKKLSKPKIEQVARKEEEKILKELQQFQKIHIKIISHLKDQILHDHFNRIDTNDVKIFDFYMTFHLGFWFLNFRNDLNFLKNQSIYKKYQLDEHAALKQALSILDTIVLRMGQVYSQVKENNQLDDNSLEVIDVCFNPMLTFGMYNGVTGFSDSTTWRTWCMIENLNCHGFISYFKTLNVSKKYIASSLNKLLFVEVLSDLIRSITLNIVKINLNYEDHRTFREFIDRIIDYYTDGESSYQKQPRITIKDLKLKEHIVTQVKNLENDALNLLKIFKKILALKAVQLDSKIESLSNLLEINADINELKFISNITILDDMKKMLENAFVHLFFQLKDQNKSKVLYLEKEFGENTIELRDDERKNPIVLIEEKNLSDDEDEMLKNYSKYTNRAIQNFCLNENSEPLYHATLRKGNINNKTIFRLSL